MKLFFISGELEADPKKNIKLCNSQYITLVVLGRGDP